MLWSQKWISRAVKTMGQSDAKINRWIEEDDLYRDYDLHGWDRYVPRRPRDGPRHKQFQPCDGFQRKSVGAGILARKVRVSQIAEASSGDTVPPNSALNKSPKQRTKARCLVPG